ncbi:class I SAM-dependent methyltransferase [Streptomyces jumonjinensis]|uniref:class I SAM-dependent methyltransferase n=1 Tax=Streptomyces jumonjinensis TaxID=1945 RepID=UPI0033267DAF
MTVTTARSSVAELLGSFAQATPAQLPEAFGRLTASVWSADGPTADALSAVPALVARLDEVDDARKGYLAIVLGLLVQSEFPAAEGGPLTAAVRSGLDRYLELLHGRTGQDPLSLALLYLLSHFPGDRERVLAAAEPLGLDPHDRSRLDRCLQRLDPDRPDLGRVWPSPMVWRLDDDERSFDQEWISKLTAEQTQVNWDNDTRTVLAYTGMRAYWAVRNGVPEETSYPVPAPPAEPVEAPELDGTAFARYEGALRCPSCHGDLGFGPGGARCAPCATTYPVARGLLDLSAGIRDNAADDPEDVTADLLQKLSEMPSMGLYYESVLRPAFLRIAGLNWGNEVLPGDEDAYLAEHIAPVDGPVLDLAAGAGRWTEVVARTVGPDRLVAQDMGAPMLTALRARLPEVPAVMASALDLPYQDGTLGAVNCWNALQAFPEQADTAIAEIGRVLRPGGTFTMMTFLWADDPIDRYFQGGHHFPSRPAGMLLFELAELKRWLSDAGMTVRELSGPGSFVFVTAERTGGGA